MYPLSKDDAILLVRKNLDEQPVNGTDMMDLDDIDSNELDSLIWKSLAEAINMVHASAPVQMLDGYKLTAEELGTVTTKDGTIKFTIGKDILRLVAFKAEDQRYPISELTPEYSARGRMMQNPYTVGTPDNPTLVLLQGKNGSTPDKNDFTGKSSFVFYGYEGTKTGAQSISVFEYIPRYKAQEASYYIAENVVDAVINQLTGMVLSVYNYTDKAAYFFNLASFNNPEKQNNK